MRPSREELLRNFQEYIDYLDKLKKEDPEQAKKEAHDSLVKVGIIHENGGLKPPYNGERVNPDDFTRGPGEINYGKALKKVKNNVKTKK